MGLKIFLSLLTAILSILTGIGIFFGSSKKDRKNTIFFLLATIGSSLWAITTILFLTLPAKNFSLAAPLATFLYLTPLFMDIFLIFYVLQNTRILRFIFIAFSSSFTCLITLILAFNSKYFYSTITISNTANYITFTNSFFYLAYACYLALTSFILIFSILRRVRQVRMKSVKKELLITSLGVAALRIIMLVLFTIVPLSHFGYIWFAPIMISLMLVLGYYAILKCQVIVLSKKWLKFLSYVVIITTAAASYMLIFYLIINVLFKIHNLSTEVYILNFLMVTILFIIMPIVSEVGGFVHTLIKRDDEYLAYLLKKMNKMTTEVDADELAEFIAKQLKFEYVGIVIGKKVHGPKSESFTDAEIKTIIALKNPEHGIWQELDSGAKNILYSHKVEAVAAMRDARGRVFGQMLIGTPRGKNDLSQKDLYELNQIVNLVSAMIDSRAK